VPIKNASKAPLRCPMTVTQAVRHTRGIRYKSQNRKQRDAPGPANINCFDYQEKSLALLLLPSPPPLPSFFS
jgi:hypothetical protein